MTSLSPISTIMQSAHSELFCNRIRLVSEIEKWDGVEQHNWKSVNMMIGYTLYTTCIYFWIYILFILTEKILGCNLALMLRLNLWENVSDRLRLE